MKMLGLFLCGVVSVMATDAAEAPSSAPAPALAAGSSTNSSGSAGANAAADAEWAEILKSARPPAPPAEWNQKAPNAEQMAAFKKEAGAAAEQVAERFKKFAEKYPDYPKIEEAHKREKVFRQQAQSLKGTSSGSSSQAASNESSPQSQPAAARNPAYDEKLKAEITKIKSANALGPAAAIEQLTKSGQNLAKDFPDEKEPWQMLMEAARYSPAPGELAISKFIAANAKDARLKEYAEERVRALDRLGKPASLSFTAVDGREADLAKLKGKVVLIDFWATWCGPCVAEVPNVKRVYEELHESGFEILGVSGDHECDDLTAFIKKNKLPWPQVCDQKLGPASILKDYGITKFPTMYLVDKKGIIRDMDARDGFEQKVRNLLKE